MGYFVYYAYGFVYFGDRTSNILLSYLCSDQHSITNLDAFD
jgi:hypothetical protein